jgi:hypothetical protein
LISSSLEDVIVIPRSILIDFAAEVWGEEGRGGKLAKISAASSLCITIEEDGAPSVAAVFAAVVVVQLENQDMPYAVALWGGDAWSPCD